MATFLYSKETSRPYAKRHIKDGHILSNKLHKLEHLDGNYLRKREQKQRNNDKKRINVINRECLKHSWAKQTEMISGGNVRDTNIYLEESFVNYLLMVFGKPQSKYHGINEKKCDIKHLTLDNINSSRRMLTEKLNLCDICLRVFIQEMQSTNISVFSNLVLSHKRNTTRTWMHSWAESWDNSSFEWRFCHGYENTKCWIWYYYHGEPMFSGVWCLH